LSRQELKLIYIVTLTLTLFMTLFVAIALAVILARRLSEPLANLAQATQAVARGDFSGQTPVTSRDEFGVLTESFNSMTRQLDEARRVVEANRAALETAKARLENILANLTAGVLVFDPQLALSIANRGARGILGSELDSCSGLRLEQWPEGCSRSARRCASNCSHLETARGRSSSISRARARHCSHAGPCCLRLVALWSYSTTLRS
jgi:nitrogen fixation/metabolism regulation signal transduction histidine kinase